MTESINAPGRTSFLLLFGLFPCVLDGGFLVIHFNYRLDIREFVSSVGIRFDLYQLILPSTKKNSWTTLSSVLWYLLIYATPPSLDQVVFGTVNIIIPQYR